jgi:hypothetical protein
MFTILLNLNNPELNTIIMNNQSGVYIIDSENTSTIKIGWTSNFSSLYKRYRTQYGRFFTAYRFASTNTIDERTIQHKMMSHHVDGELFHKGCLRRAIKAAEDVTGTACSIMQYDGYDIVRATPPRRRDAFKITKQQRMVIGRLNVSTSLDNSMC